MKWYHYGLNAFCENVPGIYQIYKTLGDKVRYLTLNKTELKFVDLIDITQKKLSEVRHQLKMGRDRLLELNSYKPNKANELIVEISKVDNDTTIDRYMLNVFRQFGITADEISKRTYQLNLLLLNNPEFPIPVGRQNGFIITFDRTTALSHEDFEFLSWDHPMVIGAIDLILGSEKGNSAFATCRTEITEELILEAIFIVECVAPKNLHIDRFLPPTPIRIIVNHTLHDCSEEYTDRQFAKNLKDEMDVNLLDYPQIKQELLPKMLEQCTEIAEHHVSKIVDIAQQKMMTTLNNELMRLIKLKEVNKNIKEDEILLYRQEIESLQKAINSARLRLDALRCIPNALKCN